MVPSAPGVVSASAPPLPASNAGVAVPVMAAVTYEGMAIFCAAAPVPASVAAERAFERDANTGARTIVVVAEGVRVTGAPPEVADANTGASTGVRDARGTRGDGRLAPHAERTWTTRGVTGSVGGAVAFGATRDERFEPHAERTWITRGENVFERGAAAWGVFARGLPQAERTCTTWRWVGLASDAATFATGAAACATGVATLTGAAGFATGAAAWMTGLACTNTR